jgi:signal transduction histidine kinase/CheY-like chemotaxis protein
LPTSKIADPNQALPKDNRVFMLLTRWLVEFRDPKRELAFLAHEEEAHLRALRWGLATVAALVLFACWTDIDLLSARRSEYVQFLVTARVIELMGILLAAASPLRKRFAIAYGWYFVLGCGLISVGHQLSSYALDIGAGRPVNVFWTALFVLLSLAAFIHPLRFGILAALELAVAALLTRILWLPYTTRDISLDIMALGLSFGVGVAMSYRLNGSRRREFSALEIERQTNRLLSDEVEERVQNELSLLAHANKLEARLLAAQKLEAIGRLAGGVAHDLNNLLTPILGYTDLALSETQEQPEVASLLLEVSRAAESAKNLVSQLLAFGRRQHLDARNLDLVSLINEQRPALCSFLREGIELKLVCAQDGAWVLADKTQLIQVLVNLVVNARDAINTAGTIGIELDQVELTPAEAEMHGLERTGKYVRLVVNDSGQGMDEATRSQVFEPFFTTKEVGKGTGLGLSTVYGIIKQHLGTIQVESQSGLGSRFVILLPLTKPQPEDCQPQSQALERQSGGNERILVVDDDPVVRELLVRLLTRNGYQVTAEGSGQQALATAASAVAPFDLLVSDIRMDGMRGTVLWDHIKRLYPASRVLFVSGYAEEASLGGLAEAVLAKPFSRATLLAKVRQLLDSRSSEGS